MATETSRRREQQTKTSPSMDTPNKDVSHSGWLFDVPRTRRAKERNSVIPSTATDSTWASLSRSMKSPRSPRLRSHFNRMRRLLASHRLSPESFYLFQSLAFGFRHAFAHQQEPRGANSGVD